MNPGSRLLRRLLFALGLAAALAVGAPPAATAALAAGAAPASGGATPGPAGAPENDPALTAAVDAYLAPLVNDDLISGTVLIARGGRVLVARGYGPANREHGAPCTPETKFRLGSLTKQFTAAAVLVLEQQGKLATDDPLAKYYPDFPRAGEIKLHHLLSHTSGIPNFNNLPDYGEKYLQPLSVDQVIAWFQPAALEFTPGEKFAYSNSNYVLLAGIIEKASGQPYAEFLRQSLFEPLGMRDTGQDSSEKVLPHRAAGHVSFGEEVFHASYRDMPFMSGAGSLYSTARDLLTWDQALCGERVLTAASKEKMFTAGQGNYGYGWFVEERGGRRVISHRGEISGFIVSMDRYVDDRVLVVTLFNYESVFARRAIRGLCDLALGNPPQAFFATPPPVVPADALAAYAGAYLAGEGDTLRVRVDGDKLVLRGSRDPRELPAVPQSDTIFWIRGLKSMVKFERDAAGEVGRLILLNSVHQIPMPRL